MKTVGLSEAKTRLSELCRAVAESGETILIERRGQPIAQLSPPSFARGKRSSILEDLARFDSEHPRDPAEPDFPDVWRELSMPGPSPLD